MMRTFRFALPVLFALGTAFAAKPNPADKPLKWDGNTAELRTYDIGGIHGQCAGLVDVRYSMVNGDIPRSLNSDDDVILNEALYKAQTERIIADIVREDSVSSAAASLQPAWRSFRDPDSRIQQRLNQYGRRRQAGLYQAILSRGDTTSEAVGTFTTVNDAFARFYVPQRTRDSCYAASLETAFRYLQMKGGYLDFVNRRNGVCPALSSGSRSAAYGEILAAIRSTVLNKQTAAFDWSLPGDSSAVVRHQRFRQRFAMGAVQDDGSSNYWFAPNDMVAGMIGHALLPSVVPGRQPLSQNSPLPPTRSQSQPLVDQNGNQINLYELWTWHRNNNPNLGGHVWPLKSTGDLIAAMMNREAILVGFGDKSAGHTVLVTGLRYKPRVEYSDGSIYYSDRSLILDIRVLDPLDVNQSQYWIGDVNRFFQNYRFGIAITDGIAV